MPFKSKAQQKFMFAAEARGDVPQGTAEEWAHKTKSIKKLPEYKHGKSSTPKLKKWAKSKGGDSANSASSDSKD